jgi:hypothetical protein
MMTDFLNYCIGTGDANGCNALMMTAAGKACAACILTPAHGSARGPLVDYFPVPHVSVDTAGCVAHFESSDAGTPCADALTALDECHTQMCAACFDPNAPWNGDPCDDTLADTTTCAALVPATACAGALIEAGAPAAQCFADGGFAAGYRVLVPLFCGSNADGGDSG